MKIIREKWKKGNGNPSDVFAGDILRFSSLLLYYFPPSPRHRRRRENFRDALISRFIFTAIRHALSSYTFPRCEFFRVFPYCPYRAFFPPIPFLILLIFRFRFSVFLEEQEVPFVVVRDHITRKKEESPCRRWKTFFFHLFFSKEKHKSNIDLNPKALDLYPKNSLLNFSLKAFLEAFSLTFRKIYLKFNKTETKCERKKMFAAVF